ncbi:acetyltransferase [Liquorilactobacillus aquaticus DSM 21051]|uniref:Acetyltransferase n=1 Tax=Liquorilactobacillus aquaticus DSM 21051 TaxID=1423725 RepID=A0A0R2CXA3_9LACO|nr:GNAT family N-acetyltransferase [Liquorilactobacillus aquaticus]KRM96224.1 acetyltransferase [Liquorilactobacillus aquaticus DSM 21051]
MFRIKTTTDLSSDVYRDALYIRKIVFVEEQKVPVELELDNEESAQYYVVYEEGARVATARVLREQDGVWHIQRVATLKEYRHRGFAKKLLQRIESDAKLENTAYLTLGAQDQVQAFYRALGYVVKGKGFMDAGIPHHRMDKKLI